MKAQELIESGFKENIFDEGTWYELSYGNHKFLTNDSSFNKDKDDWHIGYQNEKSNQEFWFSNRLKKIGQFKIIFRIITGKEFKLAHQQKLINKP